MAFAQLKSRAIVTLIGAPLVIFCVMFGKIPFMILLTFILAVSLWEFFKMTRMKGAFPDTVLSILTALLLLWDMYFFWAQHFLMIVTLYVALISILQLRQTKGSQIVNLSVNLWGVVFLGGLISFFVAIRQLPPEFELPYHQGGYWTLIILLVIWIGDSVAYFVGSSFGKHKLAKRISPKKTIEGAVAGFISMIIMSIAFYYIFPIAWNLSDAIVIGFICGTIGQISDLVESQFKRDAGIKDSSEILPGHGGIFDRFDVLYLTPPVLFFYLKYFSSFV